MCWALFEMKKRCNYNLLLVSFSYGATCMDEDSAGVGGLAEQLLIFSCLQWIEALSLLGHVGVASLKHKGWLKNVAKLILVLHIMSFQCH